MRLVDLPQGTRARVVSLAPTGEHLGRTAPVTHPRRRRRSGLIRGRAPRRPVRDGTSAGHALCCRFQCRRLTFYAIDPILRQRMGRKSRTKRERKERDSQFIEGYVEAPPVKYPVRPRPSAGSTGSERALARLARETFLSLWSYPNVVRDEPQGNGVIGKEIADLMIVFEDDVVLFSDKDCVFPATGNLDVDWARWYRSAVDKSAKQLWVPSVTSENIQIESLLTRSAPSRSRFPCRIIANACASRGGRAWCLGAVPTGTRRERQSCDQARILGVAHQRPRAQGGSPFAVGLPDATKPFIHVLDDTSLELLLGYLDTVSDFVGYLRKKEVFISDSRLGMAAGEEALLGWYVSRLNEFGEHDFVVPEAAGDRPMAFDESYWHRFLKSPELHRKRQADEVSYLWDGLIEQFAGHFMAGTSHHLSDAESTHIDFEKVLGLLTGELDWQESVGRGDCGYASHDASDAREAPRYLSHATRGPILVSIMFPFPENLNIGLRVDYEHYREVRTEYLNSCLSVVKLKWPDALDIVGFATESGRQERGSEDAAYLDAREWSDAAQEKAKRLQQDLAILVNPNMIAARVAGVPTAGQ